MSKLLTLSYASSTAAIGNAAQGSFLAWLRKLFHGGAVRRLALYTALATLSGLVAIVYYWPNQDPNSGKKLFQKRTVINAVLGSFLYTMRKSKLILSMVSSAAVFTYVAGAQLRRFNIQMSNIGLFSSWFGGVWGLAYYFLYVESPNARFQRTFWNVHIVEKSKLAKIDFSRAFGC